MPKTLDMTRILREQKEQLRAGFQDRLVMTTSISLRKYDATACIIFTELLEMRLGELCSSNPLRIPHSKIDKLAGACAECGYLRHRRTIPLMQTVHFYSLCCAAFFSCSRFFIVPQKRGKVMRGRGTFLQDCWALLWLRFRGGAA